MSLIARKAGLIIDSVARENPTLPIVPTIHNCWVWHYRYEDDENGWCYIRGRAGSGLTGKRLVKYRKLDLAVLLQGCTLQVPRTGTATTSYVGQINTMFGLDLTVNDIVNKPVADTDTHFTLEMLSTHTLYRGKVEFSIGIRADKISTVITARDLEVDIDVYRSVLQMPGSMLSAGHDYSEIGGDLTAYNVNYLFTDTRVVPFVQLLQSVDNVPWGVVAATKYSLFGATVLYNGSTKDCDTEPFMVNTAYDRVLIINPISDDKTTFGPYPIVFHYNLYAAART